MEIKRFLGELSEQSFCMNKTFCGCLNQACLVRDSPCIVIYCEHWQGNFGLGVVGTVAMVIVTFLQECVVCSLGQKRDRAKEKRKAKKDKGGP